MTRTVRNVLIILAIAAIVDFVPGGGRGAGVVSQAVWLAFLVAIGWFAMISYREHRYTLEGLGTRRRAIIYGAAGVAAFTLTATHRMWSTSLGSVLWILLLGGAVYAVVSVVLAARRY